MWLGQQIGSPDLRIINPDVLVEDRNGDTELEQATASGVAKKMRFRKDPVYAVAKTIAEVRGG